MGEEGDKVAILVGGARKSVEEKDLEKAEVHLLDAGHFALETNGKEIADLMLDFLGRNGI